MEIVKGECKFIEFFSNMKMKEYFINLTEKLKFWICFNENYEEMMSMEM